MSINEINNMRILECCVPEINANENMHYNPLIKNICVHNLKEKLDNKTYFVKCLIKILQFHVMKITYSDDNNKLDYAKGEAIDNEHDAYAYNKIKKYNRIEDNEYNRLNKTQLIYDKDYMKKM